MLTGYVLYAPRVSSKGYCRSVRSTSNKSNLLGEENKTYARAGCSGMEVNIHPQKGRVLLHGSALRDLYVSSMRLFAQSVITKLGMQFSCSDFYSGTSINGKSFGNGRTDKRT